MKIDTNDPNFFLRPASRSYHFLMSTIFIGSDILSIIILLVKRLGSLPVTTVFAMVVAIFLLAQWWRMVYRRHESIALLLRSREELLSDPTALPLLRACADLIHWGLFRTALLTFMLLMAILPLLR
jgi:hypothetical protein